MPVARRVVLWVLVAGAGSALFASPAAAGGVAWDTGVLTAAVYNVTPYTWTLVQARSFTSTGGDAGALQTTPAATIAPGGGSLFGMNSNAYLVCIAGPAGLWWYGYDSYFTYQVDVLGGPPEYVTVGICQAESNGCYPYSARHARADVYITSAPPPAGWDPASLTPPGPAPANQQLVYAHNVPYLFDQTIEVAGNYTVDASTDLGAPFVNVLNTLCSGAANTTCSFTQQGPLTWGTGVPGSPWIGTHCGVGSGNLAVSYTPSVTTTLSVGGSLTLGAQVTLFDVESNEIDVSVEAQHDWTLTKSQTRTASMDVTGGQIGHLWAIPTVGKVVGTLVVSDGSATFTANNFTTVRSGVTRDNLTPAYDAVTKVRPMTAAELQIHCPSAGSTLRGASRGKPPVKLVPGHGVAGVSLGQTQQQVERGVGQAKRQQFLDQPCQGLEPGCDAVRGTGGRWPYRKLTVVFGHDRRVSGLIYRGAQRSRRGAGVGASEFVVRGSHPQVTCSRPARGRKDCTLIGTNGGHTVKTVFGFRRMSGGRYKCDRVRIYVLDGARERVGS